MRTAAPRHAGLAVRRHTRVFEDVLEQRAAARDVQHLEAAAVRERWHRHRGRGVGERGLEVVGPARDAVGLLVRSLPVQRGVDIGAAREQ